MNGRKPKPPADDAKKSKTSKMDSKTSAGKKAAEPQTKNSAKRASRQPAIPSVSAVTVEPSGVPVTPVVAADETIVVTCTDGEVRERAYYLWMEAGKPAGCELEHWYRAKHELEHGTGAATK